MIKQYIAYLWKKTYKLVLIAFLIFFLAYPVALLVQGRVPVRIFSYGYEAMENGDRIWKTVETAYTYRTEYTTMLANLTVLAMAASYLIPIIVQGTFQNKKRCDNLFALPLKKETQILLTSAYGFVVFLAVWWLTALLGLGTSFILQLQFNVPYFFLYLLCMSVLSLGVYGITTLFASLMNNVIDSVLMVLISVLLPVVFSLELAYDLFNRNLFLYTVPIYAADDFTCFFQQEVAFSSEGLKEFIRTLGLHSYHAGRFSTYSFGSDQWIALSALTGCGILAYAASYLLWRRVRAEQMQTPSQKWYGYPVAFSAIMMIVFNLFSLIEDFSSEMLLVNAILIVAYFVGMFIFQRKIKFNKTNLISFAASFLLGNLLALIL